jgi:hypothetical protein
VLPCLPHGGVSKVKCLNKNVYVSFVVLYLHVHAKNSFSRTDKFNVKSLLELLGLGVFCI